MTARAPLVFGSDGLIQQIQSGDVLNAATGTSFPGSPGTGDRFWRSDRGIEYYYDGTRWLSTTLYTVAVPISDVLNPQSATPSGAWRAANLWGGQYALFALDAIFHNYISATSTWTLAFKTAAGSAAPTTIASRTTSGDAALTHLVNRVAVNAVVLSTVTEFEAGVTLTSGASSLYADFGLTYRLIG